MIKATKLLFLAQVLLAGTTLAAAPNLLTNFLLSVGGGGASNNVEMISIDPTANKSTNLIVPTHLQNLSSFPVTIQGHAGALLNPGKTPVVCGGKQAGATSKTCYRYNYATDQWEKAGYMPNAVAHAGYASSSEWGLVIAGGNWGTSDNNVFSTKDGANFENFPPIPTAVSYPCLAVVDCDTLFVTGGHQSGGEVTGATYLYKKSWGIWKSMPNMPTPRASLKCALVANATTGVQEIIAVGGWAAGASNKVEVFNIGLETWTTAADIPGDARWNPSLIQFDEAGLYGFILAGGNNNGVQLNEILNYNSVNKTLDVLPQTMQTGRDVTFSTMVDVSLFPEAPAAP